MMTAEQIARSRGEWDFQMRRAIRHQRVWQALAALMCATAVALLWYAAADVRPLKLAPYVVDVRASAASGKGLVEPVPTNGNEAAIERTLERFVSELVSVSTDPVVLKDKLRDTYLISTPSAQAEITLYIVKTDPFKTAREGEHVTVRFIEALPEDGRTWYLEWVEELWAKGEVKARQMITGEFTYVVRPLTELEAENDPFGIFIDKFSITPRRG